MNSYYLDCIGVKTSASTTKSIAHRVKGEAKLLSWGVSLRLSPGSLGCLGLMARKRSTAWQVARRLGWI